MPSIGRVLKEYRYDSIDRLVALNMYSNVTLQRFYCGATLSNELSITALLSHVRAGTQRLGVRIREVGGASALALIACEQQGSVLLDLSEAGQQRLAYTPYGEGAEPGLPGFNGEQPDRLTGNYLLGNGYRAYNPALMRFHSPDSFSPFGGGGLSTYSYCLGDPVNRVDPTGHMSWQAGLGVGLGVLGVLYGGSALAFGGVALATGVSAASAAVVVSGAAGMGAAGAGIAEAIFAESNPNSAASAALGWVALGLGSVALLAGVAANQFSPINQSKPTQISRVMGEGPQGPAAIPVALHPSRSPLELLDDIAFRTIVRYLPGDDLVNLSLTSSRMSRQVQANVNRLEFGLDAVDIRHHRAVWGGMAPGYLPSQVGTSAYHRFAAHSLPLEEDMGQESLRLGYWKTFMRSRNAAIPRATYTHL